MRILGLILFMAVEFSACCQVRTWVFSENGMAVADGGSFSYRKGGRIDAQFIGFEDESTVILRMVSDLKQYEINVSAFALPDREYLADLWKSSHAPRDDVKPDPKPELKQESRQVQIDQRPEAATASPNSPSDRSSLNKVTVPALEENSAMTFLKGLGTVLLIFFVYFLPTTIGWKKRNRTAILVLNFFLGWTFIGWVVALVWASIKE